jgi:DeoR/GlpR family transcriptional regulator of sugar metabolism
MSLASDPGLDVRTSPEERRRFLLAKLRADGRLVAVALARELETSEDTIRRDLRELAAAGLVQRVHGGALPPSPALEPFAVRRHQAADAKEALAAAAARLPRDGQVVLIDGGTTNLAIARLLPPGLRLTVVTPSPPVALALADHPCADVILLGGRLDKTSQSVTGAGAIDAVRSLRADLCFLGVCSIDPEVGITVSGYDEAELKRVMIQAATQVIAAATASKLGTAAPFVIGPAEALTGLVTERSVPEAMLAAFVARGVAVTRV